MDKKQAKVDTAEEIEEAPKIPANFDSGWLRSDRCKEGVGQHAPIEFALASSQSLCNKP